jgi:hypothetical protein
MANTTHAREDRFADRDADSAAERAKETECGSGRGHVTEWHRRLNGEKRRLEEEADTKRRNQQEEDLLDTVKKTSVSTLKTKGTDTHTPTTSHPVL